MTPDIGDLFPDSHKKQYADRSILPGSVIRFFSPETHPPKIKRFIVVAHSFDKKQFAKVFINTEPAPFIQRNPVLFALQLPILPEEFNFLEHKSYIDCSWIYSVDLGWMKENIFVQPACVIGEISPQKLKEILDLLKKAPNIRPAAKKQFGFFL